MRKRLRPQYRLATLVLVITVVCVALGVWAERERRYHARRAAVAVLVNDAGMESDELVDAGYVGINGMLQADASSDVWHRYFSTLAGRLPYLGRPAEPDSLRRDDVVDYVKWPSDPAFYTDYDGRVVPVTDEVLSAILQLPTLRCLELCGSGIKDEQLRGIAELSRLEQLDLSATDISDDGVRWLTDLGCLRYLDLSGTNVGDSGVGWLAGMRALRYLDLSGTKISGDAARDLARLPSLEDLDLSNTAFGDDAAHDLPAMRSLRSLYLDFTSISDAAITDVAAMGELEELSLCGTRITDDGISRLTGLQSLRGLNLSETKITGAGLARLPPMPRLESLLLEDDNIGGGWAAHLDRFRNLSELNLNGTQADDETLKAIGRLEALVTLHVRQCRAVSDAGLLELGEVKSLRRVFAAETSVTGVGAAKLKALNPLLEVSWSEVINESGKVIKVIRGSGVVKP